MSEIIYVQFGDAVKTKIVGLFNCPQDASVFPNQEETTTADPLYKAYYDELKAIDTRMIIGLPIPESES